MTSYASTAPAAPALRLPAAPRVIAASGIALGGLVLAGLGVALPIAQGFVGRGVIVGAPGDVALLDAIAPIAPLLLAIGIVHVAVGLAVAGGRWIGIAKGLATVDAMAGVAVVALAAIAGASGGDARSDLAGAGFVTLIAAIVVATALRAGDGTETAAA